jgi:hypothetical protein
VRLNISFTEDRTALETTTRAAEREEKDVRPRMSAKTISFALPGPWNGRGFFMRESALTKSLVKRILQNKENVKR